MNKVQKTYTADCKREAVRLAQTSGKPIAQAARELGISNTSIHQWRKDLAAHEDEAWDGLRLVRHSVANPCRGFEAMNMLQKGQLQGVNKGDVRGHVALIAKLFGVAA